MTTAKKAAWTIGVLGIVAVGVAVGPSLMHRDTASPPPPAVTAAPSVPEVSPKARAAVAPRAKASDAPATIAPKTVAVLPASEPELHARLKPVLNRGTRMSEAAAGFRDAEQFATVAHAARNTEVPFMVLKHRVLDEGQTLAAAIRASKPDVDATREVTRARNAARFDIAVITG